MIGMRKPCERPFSQRLSTSSESSSRLVGSAELTEWPRLRSATEDPPLPERTLIFLGHDCAPAPAAASAPATVAAPLEVASTSNGLCRKSAEATEPGLLTSLRVSAATRLL